MGGAGRGMLPITETRKQTKLSVLQSIFLMQMHAVNSIPKCAELPSLESAPFRCERNKTNK